MVYRSTGMAVAVFNILCIHMVASHRSSHRSWEWLFCIRIPAIDIHCLLLLQDTMQTTYTSEYNQFRLVLDS